MTIKQNKSSKAFREWRKRMSFTQTQAADVLGLGWATIRCYDTGRRWGPVGPVIVPKIVLLACRAVESNLQPVE